VLKQCFGQCFAFWNCDLVPYIVFSLAGQRLLPVPCVALVSSNVILANMAKLDGPWCARVTIYGCFCSCAHAQASTLWHAEHKSGSCAHKQMPSFGIVQLCVSSRQGLVGDVRAGKRCQLHWINVEALVYVPQPENDYPQPSERLTAVPAANHRRSITAHDQPQPKRQSCRDVRSFQASQNSPGLAGARLDRPAQQQPLAT
jgi:hypothetical protein